ncbi:hypothetical protein C0995_015451 [Termitomyces sp. Mi166|nr:hypothetical protein C0995_015451 [Termitomyces sp. Mi166\
MLPASTNSSTTTLTSPPLQKAQPKNYETALGALSATYGFGPGAFTSTPLPATPSAPQRTSPSSQAATRPPVSTPSHTQKDYNAAFGSLVSSYGFNGVVPPRSGTSK